MTVEERDLGWKALKAFLARAPRTSVFVGVRGNAPARTNPDGSTTSMALVATVNEFGSADGRIPERSFLRSTIDENRDDFAKRIGAAVSKAIEHPEVLATELALVGERAVSKVRRKITALREPPNAPATIAKKRSANPLIDTGQMRAAIDYELREK